MGTPLVEHAMAALNRDPAAIRDAARGLTASAGPVADHGAQVARTWRGCGPFYVAPEAPVLVAALDPVVTDTQGSSDDLDRVGSLLSRYADRIEPLVEEAKALTSTLGPQTPAAAAAAEQRLNAILMELSALDLELAQAIRKLVGNAGLNPIPARIKLGESSTKGSTEVTIGIIKIGQNVTVVETRFSDGKVMFTLVQGDKVGLTAALGGGTAAGPAGLTAKVELAPGVSFENGSSWIVPAGQADAFRALFTQYAVRDLARSSFDESIVFGALGADVVRPVPGLPPPDLVATNFEVPVELKGKLDAAPPGPVDVTANGTVGVTPKWSEIRLKDGSTVSTFGGDASLGGDVRVYRDDPLVAGGGSVEAKGVDGASVSVTRDPSGHITRVVLTSSSDAQQAVGANAGPGFGADPQDGLTKAGPSGKHTTGAVDVTTTNLTVNDGNRAIVEQWAAQHEGDPSLGVGGASTFYPETADPGDPFQNVLHTDAQVSKVRYENVTDKVGIGGTGSLGSSLGLEVGGESTSSSATDGTYLDRPGLDGHRAEKPLPRFGN